MTRQNRSRQTYTRKPNLTDVQAVGHDTLRLVNRRILLSLISDRQPISRADIARISGLNKATVSTIMNELLRERCVIEEGLGNTTPSGGKPPTPLRINELRFGIFGLDVRADETILALADFNSRIVARHSFKTGADPQALFRQLGKEIRKLRREHGEFDEAAGVGVSLPGLVDNHRGTFLMSVVLPWGEAPVRAWLEAATGLPVIVDSSARCAALAEIWHGKARYAHMRNLLFVSVSSGLSCGLVIDGGLYRGGHNTAGQFGHMPIDLNGERCRCGLRGCWDLYASDNATLARYRQIHGKGNGRAVTMRRLVEMVESGDLAAMKAVRETAHYLGVGIAGLVNGLDPEAVIIGGEITKAWGLIEPIITGEVTRNVLDPRAREIPIRRSAFEVRPTLKGALALVLNEQLSVPHVG
ncbi:MAG TPA: ROK family protein [Blastocatellia bacterium]|nr:ROK family protein [Blastocatellia bacterium]